MKLATAVYLSITFISIVSYTNGEPDNHKSNVSESEEVLPSPEALTLIKARIPNKAVPLNILNRNDDVIVVRGKREPPIRILKRRPKPPPVHLRRPALRKNKPKPKYGPPNVNFKPLTSYTPEYFSMSNLYQQSQKSSTNTQSLSPSGPSVVYPSQTFGEPPVIPVATISESKFSSGPPKTNYGTPSFSASLPTSYSSSSFSNNNQQFKIKPSVTRPSNNYGTPVESEFTLNSGISSFSVHGSFDATDSNFNSFKTSNFDSGSSKYKPQDIKTPIDDDYSINDFPLDNGYVPDLYKTAVSSYDVSAYDRDSSSDNYPFGLKSPSLPSLPNHYDQQQFKTPTRSSNGLQTGSNSFYNSQDYTSYLNDVSESKKVETKQKNKQSSTNFGDLEKELKAIKLPPSFGDKDDDLKYAFTQRSATTTVTTKRPKYRRKKRPIQKETNSQHTLDTDDLRDAYGENTDFHEVSLTPEELLDFEPKRKVVTSRQNLNNFNRFKNNVKNFESSEEITEPSRSKIHSTLTRSRIRNSINLPPTSYPLKSLNEKDEKVEIMSIEKSKSHSFYGGAVPENEFLNSFGLARRSDDTINEFSVGTGISFGGASDTITGVWNGDYEPLPKNHKYS